MYWKVKKKREISYIWKICHWIWDSFKQYPLTEWKIIQDLWDKVEIEVFSEYWKELKEKFKIIKFKKDLKINL